MDTPSKKPLEWQYSRNQLRHWAGPYGDGSAKQGHDSEWIIRDCRPQFFKWKPEYGYDLYHWKKHVAHGKTVKELKAKAENLWQKQT